MSSIGDHTRRQFLGASLASAMMGARAWYHPAPICAAEEKTLLERSQIASVRLLGKQFLDNPVNVTGLDGATSTKLPSGEALWMFGDTVEGPFKSIRDLELTHLCSNTAAVVPRQDVAEGIRQFRFLAQPDGKRPRQPLPFAADEDPAIHRVWPIHGVCVGQDIFIFYHRITLLKGVDVFVNFQLDGMGIARARVGDFKFERLLAPDGTREFWKGSEPTFGVFVDRVGGYVYLWGSLATGMHLARTRETSIADLSSYEYLLEAPTAAKPTAAVRWGKKAAGATPLFDSVPNEMSAAYNAHLKKFVAFHSLHRENKIVMRMAPAITGPWSELQLVYRPERIGEADLIYAAKEHPELASDDGKKLYVTFVNSANYVPQMIEVTLK